MTCLSYALSLYYKQRTGRPNILIVAHNVFWYYFRVCKTYIPPPYFFTLTYPLDQILQITATFLGVRIAQSVKRRATGWTAPVRFPAVQDFSLLHSVQAGSGAHTASYPMGIGGSFTGGKRQGREADRSPPSSAEVKNGGAIPPLPTCLQWHSA
jgi:hypothetical protein